jgi:nicotinamide mononucleotide adenylyltransferase
VRDFVPGASVADFAAKLADELVVGLGHDQVERRRGW